MGHMVTERIVEVWAQVQVWLDKEHTAEICLAIMGAITLAMLYAYREDREAMPYKTMVSLGVLYALFMAQVISTVETGWSKGTMIVCTAMCFALIIRPLRNIRIDVITGLIAMVWAYTVLGTLAGTVVGPTRIDLEFLSYGVPRIVMSVAIGATVYMVMGFASGVVQLFGKILNTWPILVLMSDWCIIESMLLIAGYESLYEIILVYFPSNTPIPL